MAEAEKKRREISPEYDYRTRVDALYQAIVLAIGLIILITGAYIKFRTFIPLEPIKKLNTTSGLSEDKKVIVGLVISDLSQFNVEKNEFGVEGTVWFNFDPSKVPLDLIKKFRFEHGKIEYKSKKPILEKKGNRTVAKFNVSIDFTDYLNFEKFPLDDHYITLSLINKYLPPDVEFVTVKDSFLLIAPDLKIPAWKIVEKFVKAGFQKISLEEERDVVFKVNEAIFALGVEREDLTKIIVILLALSLVIFSVNFSYSVAWGPDPNVSTMVGQSLISFMSFWFVILSISPDHAGYFMLSDLLLITSLIFLVLDVILWIYTQHRDLALVPQNVRLKKIMLVIPYALFVIISLIFIWM